MRPLFYYYAPEERQKGTVRRLPSEDKIRERPHHFDMPLYSLFHNGDLEAEEAHYMAIDQWCKDNLKHSVRKRRNWIIRYSHRRVEIRDDADAFAFRMRWC